MTKLIFSRTTSSKCIQHANTKSWLNSSCSYILLLYIPTSSINEHLDHQPLKKTMFPRGNSFLKMDECISFVFIAQTMIILSRSSYSFQWGKVQLTRLLHRLVCQLSFFLCEEMIFRRWKRRCSSTRMYIYTMLSVKYKAREEQGLRRLIFHILHNSLYLIVSMILQYLSHIPFLVKHRIGITSADKGPSFGDGTKTRI